jgi:hypothetical protein
LQAFPIADRAREGGGRGLAVGRDRRVGEKKRLVAGAALIPEQHSKCQKKVTILLLSFNLHTSIGLSSFYIHTSITFLLFISESHFQLLDQTVVQKQV